MTDLDPAEIFRQEASELLDSLEASLLDLGGNPHDRALVDTAFRALHTIKGSGAMFGFDAVAGFTHDFETAFDLIRKGQVEASVDLVNVSLAAKDHIRALIEDPEGTETIFGDAILGELRTLVAKRDAAVAAGAPPPPATSPAPIATASEPARGWTMHVRFDPDILRNGTNPLTLLDELREFGPCTILAETGAVPPLDELEPQSLTLAWSIELRADVTREAIEDVFMFVLDDMVLTMTPLGEPAAAATSREPETPPDSVEATGRASEPAPAPETPAHAPATAAEAPAATLALLPANDVQTGEAERTEGADRRGAPRRSEDKTSSTVRVPAERLDELMDRVGELVIAQARLSQFAESHTDTSLTGIAEEIARLAAGLRDATMGIRMVPIGTLFARFRRLIHDLSRDLGKPVEFVTVGEDTELDKTMIERLADPLVHLIRNAIDHGIEDPARRAGTGKASTGRIELRAEHVGAQVIVTVRDDGAGLDPVRIRAKAEENGIVTPGAQLSDHEIYHLIFAPGFSTAKTISALSGRGVGMDVVKRAIESMRGTIDLGTTLGAGSEVILRLPLTLAIIEGLLIRVGEGRYVIPLSAIEECVELPKGHDATHGGDFLNIRGDLVPFLRLRDLFGAEGQPDPHQKIIITTLAGERVGFVADAIIGSHQTVIKSLSKLHADVTMFSGATILGDGSAALILDVAQIVSAGQARADLVKKAA